ncbi:unnamed protein product [Anisakis simplex]|uniref:tRNA-dihydrouridine(16/17) synthase [NAD(P)(+)] n=1 Tax=Anisakis simplex TaxID=6269 RepID=A0A0M3JT93_ANISI|nr:unnamed protein product [Anisakis simplex]
MVQGVAADDNSDDMFVIGKDKVPRKNLICLTDAQKDAKRNTWKRIMQNVKCVVAPMVDQSELAFRMMLREHGADLCFSPMIHAQLFVKDVTYRKSAFSSCSSDRPLVIQFCANEPDILLSACLLVEDICDGVDLNLGCPQLIAKRGHYGAYLQEDIELVCEMVSIIHSYCHVPLSCKIRILDDIDKTLSYARALEKAGACMLTVHGRTREQRGASTGLADWNAIRIVREAVNIPVLANGNIQMPEDVQECLKVTDAKGVMSAEGVLSNPFLFEARHEPNWIVAKEYLKFARRYKAGMSAVRAHLFRICHHSLLEYNDLREKMSYVFTLREFHEIIDGIEDRINSVILTDDATCYKNCCKTQPCAPCPLDLPHWICKPYFRPQRNDSVVSNSSYRERRRAELDALAEETGLSRRQIRKREKRRIEGRKDQSKKESYPKCVRCTLPASQGCIFLFCKNCCRYKASHEHSDCKGTYFV